MTRVGDLSREAILASLRECDLSVLKDEVNKNLFNDKKFCKECINVCVKYTQKLELVEEMIDFLYSASEETRYANVSNTMWLIERSKFKCIQSSEKIPWIRSNYRSHSVRYSHSRSSKIMQWKVPFSAPYIAYSRPYSSLFLKINCLPVFFTEMKSLAIFLKCFYLLATDCNAYNAYSSPKCTDLPNRALQRAFLGPRRKKKKSFLARDRYVLHQNTFFITLVH